MPLSLQTKPTSSHPLKDIMVYLINSFFTRHSCKAEPPAHSVILNSHYSLYFLNSARTREFIPTQILPSSQCWSRNQYRAQKLQLPATLFNRYIYADKAELKGFSAGAFCSDIKIKLSNTFARLHTDTSRVNPIPLHIFHDSPYTSHPTRYQGIPGDCFASICFGMWQTAPGAGQAAGPSAQQHWRERCTHKTEKT